MAGTIEIAGDVASAASAVAGLTLVFIGAISSSFDSYQKTEQAAIRPRYQRRAWFAFAGFTLTLLATSLGGLSSSTLPTNIQLQLPDSDR